MNSFHNTSPEPSAFKNLFHISEYEEYNFYFQNAKAFLNIKEYKSALEIIDDGLLIDPDNVSLLVLKAKILIYSNHNLPVKNIRINFNEASRIFNLCEKLFNNKYSELLKAKDIRLISKESFLNYFNDKTKLDGLKEILKIYCNHFEVEINT